MGEIHQTFDDLVFDTINQNYRANSRVNGDLRRLDYAAKTLLCDEKDSRQRLWVIQLK